MTWKFSECHDMGNVGGEMSTVTASCLAITDLPIGNNVVRYILGFYVYLVDYIGYYGIKSVIKRNFIAFAPFFGFGVLFLVAILTIFFCGPSCAMTTYSPESAEYKVVFPEGWSRIGQQELDQIESMAKMATPAGIEYEAGFRREGGDRLPYVLIQRQEGRIPPWGFSNFRESLQPAGESLGNVGVSEASVGKIEYSRLGGYVDTSMAAAVQGQRMLVRSRIMLGRSLVMTVHCYGRPEDSSYDEVVFDGIKDSFSFMGTNSYHFGYIDDVAGMLGRIFSPIPFVVGFLFALRGLLKREAS